MFISNTFCLKLKLSILIAPYSLVTKLTLDIYVSEKCDFSILVCMDESGSNKCLELWFFSIELICATTRQSGPHGLIDINPSGADSSQLENKPLRQLTSDVHSPSFSFRVFCFYGKSIYCKICSCIIMFLLPTSVDVENCQ